MWLKGVLEEGFDRFFVLFLRSVSSVAFFGLQNPCAYDLGDSLTLLSCWFVRCPMIDGLRMVMSRVSGKYVDVIQDVL